MMIPAFRSPYGRQLMNSLQKTFDGSEIQKLVAPEKKNPMVLIRFHYVPILKRIRWDKKWWTKTNFKGGTNSERQGHEFEIPTNDLVGIHLKDVPKELQHHIIKDE